MKRVVAATGALIALLATSGAPAQMKWRGSGGWGPEGRYGRLYDPRKVETLRGEVVGVERLTPMKGMAPGVHMMVKTDAETVSVHLGPAWYLENQDVKLQPGDRVEVRGARVTFRGQPAVIAAEVRKDGEVLTLRDEQGLQAWSGWRRP